MKVGLDIDDVLYPWYERAHAACERAGITNGITPTSWRVWEDYGVEQAVWHQALEAGTLDGSIYLGDPMPGALEMIEHLHDAGHTVHLVTARGAWANADLIRQLTVEWLADHRVAYDSLTFAHDKSVIRTDIFLDDHPRNYDTLTAAGVETWLLEQPWNVNDRATRWTVPDHESFLSAVENLADWKSLGLPDVDPTLGPEQADVFWSLLDAASPRLVSTRRLAAVV